MCLLIIQQCIYLYSQVVASVLETWVSQWNLVTNEHTVWCASKQPDIQAKMALVWKSDFRPVSTKMKNKIW